MEPTGRILQVKYNEILTIKRNENAGFAGLSAMFTPSRENSYDKVQRDNHCTKLILLKKVGGGYIFIHRMLLDYFADMTP